MDIFGLRLRPWVKDIDGLYHPMVFDFEQSFADKSFANSIGAWMNRWWWLSIVIAIVYIGLTFYGQMWMKTRERFELRRSLILWNIFLALFSIFGMIRCVPEMIYNLNKEGLEYTICNRDNIYGITGFWITVFCWSKIPELIDTLFIVLRKQKLIFLHWFHHATVMVYALYSYHNWTASGRWFVFMNYTVHAMMYSYYAFRAMKFRIPIWVQISITVCQLLQMVVGCFVNYKAYTYKQMGNACDVTYSNIGWSFAMYFIYFGLFLHFFCIAYFPKKKVDSKVSNTTVQERKNIQKKTEKESITHLLSQIIQFGVLIVSLLYSILYPVSSIMKYITWCIYGVALIIYVRNRTVSKEKSSSFPSNLFYIKKSQ
ncbi:hypothetical protein I4U23_025946 [Adineta vaga]|nr:hypothetical protein I4U23_025946 [Adineta vaga]